MEVKLGGERLIDESANTLCRLSDEIDLKRMAMPSFRMIVTAQGEFAYERPSDGVIVCPIGALKP